MVMSSKIFSSTLMLSYLMFCSGYVYSAQSDQYPLSYQVVLSEPNQNLELMALIPSNSKDTIWVLGKQNINDSLGAKINLFVWKIKNNKVEGNAKFAAKLYPSNSRFSGNISLKGYRELNNGTLAIALKRELYVTDTFYVDPKKYSVRQGISIDKWEGHRRPEHVLFHDDGSLTVAGVGERPFLTKLDEKNNVVWDSSAAGSASTGSVTGLYLRDNGHVVVALNQIEKGNIGTTLFEVNINGILINKTSIGKASLRLSSAGVVPLLTFNDLTAVLVEGNLKTFGVVKFKDIFQRQKNGVLLYHDKIMLLADVRKHPSTYQGIYLSYMGDDKILSSGFLHSPDNKIQNIVGKLELSLANDRLYVATTIGHITKERTLRTTIVLDAVELIDF